jgi:DNA-binding transcriptional MocR family regulator
MPAYLSLADALENQIRTDAFQPGDRLPSVRHLAERHRHSIETVLHTFRVLEDRGLIEARPRSGFYVKPRIALPEPLMAPLRLEAASVELSALRYEAIRLGNSTNVVPFGISSPSPEVLPTKKIGQMISVLARKFGREIVRYVDPAGHPQLRRQLARRSSDWGCFLQPDDLVVTNGAAEAVTLCLRAVCRPGMAVLVESPTWFGTLEVIESLGLRIVEVPTHPVTGIDPGALEHALETVPGIGACLLVTNFSNPLGCSVAPEHRLRILKLLKGYRVPLIEDDIFGDLHQPDAPRPPVLKGQQVGDEVLLCSSVSKTLAPGLRIGWVAPGRYRDKVLQLKNSSTLSAPVITQLAVAEFLAHGAYDAHLRRIRAFYREQILRVSHAVATMFPPGTRVSRPQGGFVLWIELVPGANTLELARIAMNRHRISIAPGLMFSARGDRYNHCFRLSCGTPWSPRIAAAIETLGKLSARVSG